VGIYLAVNLFVCLALVILSDYGNIFVIFAVLLLMIYLLTDNRLLSLTLVLGCLGVFFLMLRFVPYAQQRLANWGTAMESGTSTQQRQIMEAVIFGGLKGIQVQRFDYLGRIYAASCDCALAGIWALNGPMALLLLLGAYAGVVYQAASVYAFRPSNYLILIQSGFVIFVQVVLNLMGTLDVLPFTGVVAPLVSSGGSAMCTFGMLLGMAMASLDPVIPAMAAEPVHSQSPFVWEEE
jgi:cell division protein FtsW